MSVNQPAKRTPEQVTAQQQIDAANLTTKGRRRSRGATTAQGRSGPTPLPSSPATPPAVMPPDNRTTVEKYLDEIAPASFPGQLIKFSREGQRLSLRPTASRSTPTALLLRCATKP